VGLGSERRGELADHNKNAKFIKQIMTGAEKREAEDALRRS